MSEVTYRHPNNPRAALDAGGEYDAGHGMRYTPYYWDEACTRLGGIWFWHPCKEERGPLAGPNGRTGRDWLYWNVETPERLGITPSILCTTCGFHGFLTSGLWEPC